FPASGGLIFVVPTHDLKRQLRVVSSRFNGNLFSIVIRSLFILLASVLAPSLLLAQSPAVTNTIFLVGDAGEPYVKDDPISRVLPQHIAAASGEVTVLFLGDNIYPSGLPDRNNKRFDVAQHSLETQIQWLNDSNARGIFIPGNHDWQHWGKKGWEYILHQQA